MTKVEEEDKKVLALDKDTVERKFTRAGNSFTMTIPRRYVTALAGFLDTEFTLELRLEDGKKRIVINPVEVKKE